MGVYYIMIIIKIEKTYFNRPNFPFPSLSNKTLSELVEPFDRVLFGCYLSGRIPSDDYGIPTCNSNDVTRSAVGLPQAARRWKQMRTHAPKRRECLHFKITRAQISSRDARFIFSLHAGAMVWPLLPNRDTFRQCFDFGFHDQIAASKSTTRQKGRTLIRACQIHHGTCVHHQTMLWIHAQCEFHGVTAHITESVSKFKSAQNVFS